MKNKITVIFILTLVFLWGIASVAYAMSGMDMGGGSDKPSSVQTPKASDTMPEMKQPQSKPSEHEKTSGMDSNMPGMKADGGKVTEDGHDEGESQSQGVNWYVVGGFLGINTLVIGSAGLLKLKAGMGTI